MSRLAPREALAEKERDCCSAVVDASDDDKDVRNVEVEVVIWSGGCWLDMRERAEENGRAVEAVVATVGIAWKRLV